MPRICQFKRKAQRKRNNIPSNRKLPKQRQSSTFPNPPPLKTPTETPTATSCPAFECHLNHCSFRQSPSKIQTVWLMGNLSRRGRHPLWTFRPSRHRCSKTLLRRTVPPAVSTSRWAGWVSCRRLRIYWRIQISTALLMNPFSIKNQWWWPQLIVRSLSWKIDATPLSSLRSKRRKYQSDSPTPPKAPNSPQNLATN